MLVITCIHPHRLCVERHSQNNYSRRAACQLGAEVQSMGTLRLAGCMLQVLFCC